MRTSVIISTLIFLVLNHNAIKAQQCYFKQVSSKGVHAHGITDDGKLYAWGSNIQGQLGIGTTGINEPSPILVNQDSDWKKVETGQSSFFSIGLKNNGSLWFWGGSFNNCLHTSSSGYSTPIQIAEDFNCKDFSTGYWRILAIRDDNTLWGWGYNEGGFLGVGNTDYNITTPTQIGSDNNWTKVSSGLNHSLALKSDGTIWACGVNNSGQLGNGVIGELSDVFIQVGGDNNWVEILACAGSNMAIKSDGTLWVWGLNDAGQLGDGTTTNRLVPTQIGTDTDWKTLGYSGYSSAAIKTNGTLWIWGYGGQGQIGNGSNTSTTVPTQAGNDTDWKSVNGGGGLGFVGTTGDHYLGLKQNNEVFGWGFNQNGVLGNNTTSDVNIPTSICNTVSSNEIVETETISIFPNPASSSINVDTKSQIKSISILNIFGQAIRKEGNVLQIDISDFQNGIYYLVVETQNNHSVLEKFSIVK